MTERPHPDVNTAAVTGQQAMPADGALLEAVKLGDNAAFEALFDRYYSRVYAVTLRVLGTPEDAEEVTLDVFMKLYERPVEQLEDGALGGWLYRSALNAAFNTVRSRKRRLGWLKRVASLNRSAGSDSDDPADIVARDSDAQAVRRALTALPERQRNALVLRSHGFRYNEIASALDIAPTSVGTTLARGERALRLRLESEAGRT